MPSKFSKNLKDLGKKIKIILVYILVCNVMIIMIIILLTDALSIF